MRAESRLSWLAVAAASGLCAAVSAVGADARWLAAIGQVVAHAGHIPSAIPYAAARSRDWVDVPVLGQLVFHWLYRLDGERALLVAQAVAVAATLILVLRDMRAAGASDRSRALVIASLPFAAVSSLFIVRAQLFSLPLFALTMLLLRSEARAPSRRLWLLVPLIALWSNLHGAVLIGLAVATAYLLFDRVRVQRLTALAVLAASCAALFATPALARTGEYYLGVLHSVPAKTGFGLWAPLSLRNPLDVVFLVVAIPLVWLALRSRPRVWETVSLVVLAGATLHVGRNSVWLALFLAVPAAAGLRLGTGRPLRGAVFACAWAVPLVLVVVGFVRTPPQTVAGDALRGDAAQLAAGRPILADAEDAERFALDGRRVWIANPIDAFDRADQQLYLNWLEGKPAGDALLRRSNVVVVQVRSKAQRRLAGNRAFREVERDSAAVLYTRAR